MGKSQGLGGRKDGFRKTFGLGVSPSPHSSSAAVLDPQKVAAASGGLLQLFFSFSKPRMFFHHTALV